MRPTGPRLTLDEFLRRHGGDYAEPIDGVVGPLVRAGTLCGHTGAKLILAFARHIDDKVADYLGAGVKAVLVLDPFTCTASVYRPHAPPVALTRGDTLTIPDVLPGFAVPVARFFE